MKKKVLCFVSFAFMTSVTELLPLRTTAEVSMLGYLPSVCMSICPFASFPTSALTCTCSSGSSFARSRIRFPLPPMAPVVLRTVDRLPCSG